MNDLLSRKIGQHGSELEIGIDELERFYKGEHWSANYGGNSPERLSQVKEMKRKLRHEANQLNNVRSVNGKINDHPEYTSGHKTYSYQD